MRIFVNYFQISKIAQNLSIDKCKQIKVVDRIKSVMEYLQMSPTTFADTIGIGRSNLTHIFSGRNQPSLDIAKKILRAFPEISTEWLIMGMGEMLHDKKIVSAKIEPVSETPATVNLPTSQTDLFGDVEEGEENEPETFLQDTQNEEPPTPSVAEVETTKKVHSQPSKRRTAIKSSELDISSSTPNRNRFLNSQADKKISKIIFFYEDQSFEIYTPC